MRRTVSILLLLVFFFQSIGCLMLFKLQQLQVRHDVKHHILSSLPNDELILIKLPVKRDKSANQSYHFLNSDEFKYAGNMYDVVRTEKHEKETWYYCYSDKKETRVLAQLNDFVKNRMANDTQKKKQRENFQQLLNSLFPGTRQQYLFFNTFLTFLNVGYSFHLKTWDAPPLIKPPQRAHFFLFPVVFG